MKMIIAGLAGASIALAASGVLAQGGAQQSAAAPATTVAISKPSVTTTKIGDLVADPRTRAVLAKDYPGFLEYSGLDKLKGITLSTLARFPQAHLDAAKLAKIQRDFDALPAS